MCNHAIRSRAFQRCRIRPTIVVEGNRRIDAQAIREHFHASSDELTPAAIDAALKELYRTGLFEDVHIVRSGTRLIVTVVEAPLIEHLRFEIFEIREGPKTGVKRITSAVLAGGLPSG